MSEKQATDISIYDHKFTLRGQSDPAYMQELATKVDARMRQVSKPGEPIHRVAILTALMLMDDLVKMQRSLDGERQRSDQAARGVAQLDLKLQTLLNEAVQAEKADPPMAVEDLPEILDLGSQVKDLFDEPSGK